MHDFEMAKDKVMMGPERRSMIISEKEKRNTAFHEAGHALVGKMMKHADPVHKVTILPRGRALGYTMVLPDQDKYSTTRSEILDKLAYMMGGRAAEELFMNHMTSGASNDIERATDIAQHMVCEWGMSALGMRAFRKAGNSFEADKSHTMSEATARRVDEEIEKIINGGYDRALDILNRNRQAVKLIAEAYTNKQIADALHMAEKTVESHRANVLRKLGMRDRVELVRYAVRRGLVEP